MAGHRKAFRPARVTGDGMELQQHSEPEAVQRRDRIAVHLIWELMLAGGVVAAAALVRGQSSETFSGAPLRSLLVTIAAALLVATGFAASLRAAVPNLAVGAIAGAAGTGFAWLATDHGYDLPTAAIGASGAAAAAGLVLGLLIGMFRAPSWAVTVAAAVALAAGAVELVDGKVVSISNPPDVQKWAWLIVGAAAALSLLGGLLGMFTRFRTLLGRYRPVADPAAAHGGGPASVAVAAMLWSGLLAGAAGVLTVTQDHTSLPPDAAGPTVAVAAIAAVLLGGTSAHGRRGGLAGTLLAVVLLQLLLRWMLLENRSTAQQLIMLSIAAGAGLVISRLVEALGTPEHIEPDEPGPLDEYGTEQHTPLYGDRYDQTSSYWVPPTSEFAAPDQPATGYPSSSTPYAGGATTATAAASSGYDNGYGGTSAAATTATTAPSRAGGLSGAPSAAVTSLTAEDDAPASGTASAASATGEQHQPGTYRQYDIPESRGYAERARYLESADRYGDLVSPPTDDPFTPDEPEPNGGYRYGTTTQ